MIKIYEGQLDSSGFKEVCVTSAVKDVIINPEQINKLVAKAGEKNLTEEQLEKEKTLSVMWVQITRQLFGL